jgi:ribokinase
MVTHVVIVGSFVYATFVETPRLPVRGESLLATRMRRTPGGKGFNMALQVSRLGGEAMFLTTLGPDEGGDVCLAALEKEKISTRWVLRDPEKPTAAGVVIHDPAGDNLIAVCPGASLSLTPADVDRLPIPNSSESSGWVVLAQLEVPLETALKAMERGRAAGALTILNPAPACDLRDLDLSTVDFLTPNETEARVCAGLAPDDLAVPLEEVAGILGGTGCGNVVITTGEAGSEFYRTGEPGTGRADAAEGDTRGRGAAARRIHDREHIAPFPVDAVDTTGAGDAFNAALAIALGEGWECRRALRFASAAAALCCTVPETIDAFADRDAVDRLLL